MVSFFVFLLLCCFVSFGACVVRTAPLPFDEERMRRWFRIDAAAALPATPRRFTNMSHQDMFDCITRGEPFIVADAARDWVGPWDASYFARLFPGQNLTAFTNAGGKKKSIVKAFGEIDFARKIYHPDEEFNKEGVPSISSWYWPIIGVEQNNSVSEDVLDLLRKKTTLPYFFEQSEDNQKMFEGRIEMFFGNADSGVLPHTDPVCESIVSVQLQGKKRWRLALPVDLEILLTQNPEWPLMDKGVETILETRMSAEHPLFDFELTAGEALVFAPGFIHSTRVPSDLQEMSTSLSLQVGQPMPILFAKEFSSIVGGDLNPGRCYLHEWNSLLFGTSTPILDLTKDGALDEEKKAVFKHLDGDENGVIDFDEMMDSLDDMSERANMSHRAHMFLLVHDHNKDNVVSAAEFEKNDWRPFLAEATIIRLLHKMDRNGDGRVSETEFDRFFPELVWTSFSQEATVPYDTRSSRFVQLFPPRSVFVLARSPEAGPLPGEVPSDFFLTIRKQSESVEFFGPSNGTGAGFLKFKDGNLFGGNFVDFKRHGCGVTCCERNESEEIIVDHVFEHDTETERGNPCPFEILDIMPVGARLVISKNLNGLGFIIWEPPSVAVFVGQFENGKRVGSGLYRNDDGKIEVQIWQKGEDDLFVTPIAVE